MPEIDYTLHYRTWHDTTTEHAKEMADYIAGALQRYLPENRQLPAIDIGCGMGFAMLALQQLRYTEVIGVDLDAGQIAVAKSHGLDARQVADTAGFLKEHPSHFGTVLLLDVLEHVPVSQQIDLLTTIRAAMTGSGRLLVQVPNATSVLAPRYRYTDWTHHCSFTEHSLRFALLSAGFQSVQIPIVRPNRPSFRLWKPSARQGFLPSLIRCITDGVWRQILKAELDENVDEIPTSPNILAIATK